VLAGTTVTDLWWDYVVLGGSGTQEEVERMLTGATVIGAGDLVRLVVALNERFDACGLGRPLDLPG
jgi:hypothetical protein